MMINILQFLQCRSKCYYSKNSVTSRYTDNNLTVPKHFPPTSCDYGPNTITELCKPTPAMKRRAKFYGFLTKFICIPGLIIAGIVTKINYDVEKRCREAQMANK